MKYSGTFLPVTPLFDGIPDSLTNVLKVEILLTTTIEHKAGKPVSQVLALDITTNRALLDLTYIKPDDVDFDKLERDCDLMKKALTSNRGEIKEVLGLICSGRATQAQLEATTARPAKVGLTEQGFLGQGGGMIGLVIAAAALLLAAGCAHCVAYKPWPKPDHFQPRSRVPRAHAIICSACMDVEISVEGYVIRTVSLFSRLTAVDSDFVEVSSSARLTEAEADGLTATPGSVVRVAAVVSTTVLLSSRSPVPDRVAAVPGDLLRSLLRRCPNPFRYLSRNPGFFMVLGLPNIAPHDHIATETLFI